MQTIEFTFTEWRRSLDEFSLAHEGWLTSVEVLARSIGAQTEIENLPLVGVSAEPHDGTATVTIAAAAAGGAQVTHSIREATHIRLERRDDGADVALAIESADETMTILRFQTTARPETLDGVEQRRGDVTSG